MCNRICTVVPVKQPSLQSSYTSTWTQLQASCTSTWSHSCKSWPLEMSTASMSRRSFLYIYARAHEPTHAHTQTQEKDLVTSIHVLACDNARCYLVRRALFSGKKEGGLRTVRTQHCRRLFLVICQRQVQRRADRLRHPRDRIRVIGCVSVIRRRPYTILYNIIISSYISKTIVMTI